MSNAQDHEVRVSAKDHLLESLIIDLSQLMLFLEFRYCKYKMSKWSKKYILANVIIPNVGHTVWQKNKQFQNVLEKLNIIIMLSDKLKKLPKIILLGVFLTFWFHG